MNKGDTELLFTGQDLHNNWFYNRYYYGGANSRYYTTQSALNLLSQKTSSPTIIETGCQRVENDLGGGMSTIIFGEYISRYGGNLISVDISGVSLECAKHCLKEWPSIDVKLVESDSVSFLSEYTGKCDLLYLDSFDYPICQLARCYSDIPDLGKAIESLSSLSREKILAEQMTLIGDCQRHALKEFQVIEDRLSDDVILMIDDNQLAGGGKPRMLKDYLLSKDWVCLMDFQQSLWVRRV
jgi:hypothetical protein